MHRAALGVAAGALSGRYGQETAGAGLHLPMDFPRDLLGRSVVQKLS